MNRVVKNYTDKLGVDGESVLHVEILSFSSIKSVVCGHKFQVIRTKI